MHKSILLLVLGLSVSTGCASPDGNTASEKTAYTLRVREEAMAQLAVRDPEAKAKVAAAPGYIFMSCFSIHPGIMTLGNGYGVVQDNHSGKQKFVRMTRFAIGPGLACKGYYTVVTLPSAEAVAAFMEGSWYGGAFAEASFHFGDTGGTAAAETASEQSDVWMWTHTGVAVELAAGGGKIYPEEELN